MEFNPYHSPESSNFLPDATVSNAVAIRQEHLSHEASVKGLGGLYVLGGVLLLIGGVGLGISSIGMLMSSAKHEPTMILLLIPLYLGLGVLQLLTGLAIRRFKPWARIVGIVFSAIGLLGFPLGTIISGYFLYLLAGRKGATIFSPQYQLIIEQTPGMKYKTSLLVKVLLVIFILLIVVGIGWLIVSPSSR